MKNKAVVKICVCAVMAALSVALAFLAKSVFGSQPLRLTFENMPVFVVSFAYGPVFGCITAVVADLLSCLLSGMAPIPFITVGAAALGIISGVIYRLKFKNNAVRIFLSVFSGHLIGSVIIKTAVLYQWYGIAVLFRIPIYIGIAAFEGAVLYFMLKRKSVVNMLKSAGGDLT